MSAEVSNPIPNDRGQHLLRVLIQRYIRDGQPVGSRTLSKDASLDLSPATIRNVMSDLEELGLVSAPHTSAGRIPTPKGYRLFVDTLVRYRQPEDTEIRRLPIAITRSARSILSLGSRLTPDFVKCSVSRFRGSITRGSSRLPTITMFRNEGLMG